MLTTSCAICGVSNNSAELYPANFDMSAFNPVVFSARRLPDRIHYRIVKCKECGLVRSDPIADPVMLGRLYRQSAVTYTEEATNIRHTYGRCLARLNEYGVHKKSLMEIGCGNGFFLEEALKQGYENVRGVEPSQSAVEEASPSIRSGIICDVMRPGIFASEQFDVICMFQVLDHIPDPAGLLDECKRMLKPGGFVLCLNHNVAALSARLMRSHSPIVDIEHTFLYSPTTATQLFKARGFNVRRVSSVRNRYSFHYLLRLAPMPAKIKTRLLDSLKTRAWMRRSVSIPIGNLCLVAQNPGLKPERKR